MLYLKMFINMFAKSNLNLENNAVDICKDVKTIYVTITIKICYYSIQNGKVFHLKGKNQWFEPAIGIKVEQNFLWFTYVDANTIF